MATRNAPRPPPAQSAIPSYTHYRSVYPAAAATTASRQSATAAPSSRLSLTSRRRPAAAYGVTPAARYNPESVLAARAASARTSSPIRFQRKVKRSDPFNLEPIQQWRNEQAEAAWQDIRVYPSLHNDKTYRAKKTLFSNPGKSLFAVDPIKRAVSPIRTSPLVGDVILESMRPTTADPLLGFLEASWQPNDLHLEDTNEELTRTQRHFFDSPAYIPGRAGTSLGATSGSGEGHPHFSQSTLDARLILAESERARWVKKALSSTVRPRSPSPRRAASMQRDRVRAVAKASKLQPALLAAELSTSPRHGVHPAEVNISRGPHLSHAEKVERATSKLELLREATGMGSSRNSQPVPSFLTHPHSTFFRYIPNRSPREMVRDLKRERDWNTNHQLANSVEGW